MRARPTSIDAMTAHLQTLPTPSVACLLASLERPLAVAAADSTTSTQPASESHPRVFVFLDDLVVTTVPSGPGAAQLELGERLDADLSLKGELHFPWGGDSPYDTILQNDEASTRCGLCHAGEVETEAGRYASRALRPHESQHVAIDFGREESERCDPENPVCSRLRGLYGFGDLVEVAFDDASGVLF